MNKKNKGFILIMVMLLLSILSLSAFVSIEQSQFSYKANYARLANMKARQISEDARLTAINELDTLLRENEFRIANLDAVSPSEKTNNMVLSQFVSVEQDNVMADVYLKELPTQMLKNGMSLTQNMAYSGLGLGLGSEGSFSTRYELRAKGIARNKGHDVIIWTASDYQFTP